MLFSLFITFKAENRSKLLMIRVFHNWKGRIIPWNIERVAQGRGSSPTCQTMASRTVSDYPLSPVLNSDFLSSCRISILPVGYCEVWAKREGFFCTINKIENSISLEDGYFTMLGRNFPSKSPFQFTSDSPSSWNFKMSPRKSRNPSRKKDWFQYCDELSYID